MLEVAISLVIAAIIIVAIAYIVSIWIYKRAPANMCFIRTGFLGTTVCLGRGALVLPVFHEITWVSLETMKLVVSRARDLAILTLDNIRVDVITELYVHVGHNEPDVLIASRSLGEKTFDAEKVRSLLEAKVVSALRSYAATKTLKELHENRDPFAKDIKQSVGASFAANGLMLEEVTIVALEQSSKEYFRTDNVFDAEGLKVITEITSEARRKVHDTEKRTTVAIRQKELTSQLELLEFERQEAFARASQDKEVANEQAKQLREKQAYVLDQRMALEQRELENEKALEQVRTERDIAVTSEAQRRETSEILKELAVEQGRRDREIALVAKAREEALVNIARTLDLEKAEKDREIELISKAREAELAGIGRNLARELAERDKDINLAVKERERQEADIARVTAVTSAEERARELRHQTSEEVAVAVRRRSLETRLAMLQLEREEAVAGVKQEQEISNERARVLSEQQRYVLDRRFEVEQQEIQKALALETAQVHKEIAIIEEQKQREAAEIRRALAREQEERDREIALVAKAEAFERAEIRRQLGREEEDRERQISVLAKDTALRQAEVRHALAIEIEEQARDIALIVKEQEREHTDIQRFLAREQAERDREIAIIHKTRELELAEVERLTTAAKREKAEHEVASVPLIATAERARQIELILAQQTAESRRIDEESKASVSRMHMLAQSEARKLAAELEAQATLIRARASTEAQKIGAEGIEREAGAQGRAAMEVEALRINNTQRQFEAEAAGLEAKADALKKYNEAATFLELARLYIEADRDVHIDQAKAMASALSGAHIRMFGGGDGTIDTIRGLFTQGFGIGELLEGLAQSLPEGLRQRFSANGIRGLLGQPDAAGTLRRAYDDLNALVQEHLKTKKAREIPYSEAVAHLSEHAGDSATVQQTIKLLKDVGHDGKLDGVAFDTVWTLIQAVAKSAD
jgi:flotillin